MSDLLKRFADYIQTLPNSNVRVSLADASNEEGRAMLADAVAKQGGHDLEGRGIGPVKVGAPEYGRFAFFMDGMQRPRGPVYIADQPVPIMYGYVAAVIRQRGIDRRMRTLPGYFDQNESLYVSQRLMERLGIGFEGLDCVWADVDAQALSEHPLALIEAARDKISTVRGSLESDLVAKWMASGLSANGWLLVDGSLDSETGRCESGSVLGVTKSHSTQYFPWDEQRVILDLNVGERSGAFIPIIGGRRRPVYSWYLRMRPHDGQDVYFGLVRVEAPKCERTLQMADKLSRWLMAETNPISLPDSRWDKMIYPIRDCELYLKSTAPSHLSLDAMLMRLAGSPRRRASV
ncbi:MAG: hypothetical protein ABFD49_01200 [Armatimonadota bacterium]|nr:hypothetical protein [bacterium]